MNRQYLITDNEANSNVALKDAFNKAYQIHELILTIPPDDFTYKLSPKKSYSHLTSEKEYLFRHEIFNDSQHLKMPLESGDVFNIDIDNNISKTTQTILDNQDRAVNTSTVCVCASTQTLTEELSEDNSSGSSDQMSYTSDVPLADTNTVTYANKIIDMFQTDTSRESGSEIDNESFEKDSVVFTYSINKSHNSNNSPNESYYTRSSSNSLEDLSETSHFVEESQQSLTSTPKMSPESGIFRLLNNDSNEECIRVSYLPAEMISNMNHFSNDIWDHYRIFEIKKFDEIIKSHQVRSDRRLKAISNRMLCKIDILGPFQSNYFQMNIRNALEWYNLIVYASNKLRLEKAINCIQLSFPSSCFNEKLYKLNNHLLKL